MILLYLWAAIMWGAASYLIDRHLRWWQIVLLASFWPIVPFAVILVMLMHYEDFQCLKSNGV